MSLKKRDIPVSTSTREALTRWIKERGIETPEAAEHVQLQAMLPPMIRFDPSLIAGWKCKQLSLSSNSLTSIPNCGSLRNLSILSVGRNCLKRIENLVDVSPTLEQLWCSYNEIEYLTGGGLERCMKLTHLYCSNNNIKKLDELLKIAHLPLLTDLILSGNPCTSGWNPADYRLMVLRRLPGLKKLDGFPVTERERMAMDLLTAEEVAMSPGAYNAMIKERVRVAKEAEELRRKEEAKERELAEAKARKQAGLDGPSSEAGTSTSVKKKRPSISGSIPATSPTRSNKKSTSSPSPTRSPPTSARARPGSSKKSQSNSATSPSPSSPSNAISPSTKPSGSVSPRKATKPATPASKSSRVGSSTARTKSSKGAIVAVATSTVPAAPVIDPTNPPIPIDSSNQGAPLVPIDPAHLSDSLPTADSAPVDGDAASNELQVVPLNQPEQPPASGSIDEDVPRDTQAAVPSEASIPVEDQAFSSDVPSSIDSAHPMEAIEPQPTLMAPQQPENESEQTQTQQTLGIDNLAQASG